MDKEIRLLLSKKIIDILGIFTNNMPNIKNYKEYFINNDFYSAQICLNSDAKIKFLYKEIIDPSYNTKDYYLMIYSKDTDKKMFCYYYEADNEKFGDVYSFSADTFVKISNYELSNLWGTIELIQQLTSSLSQLSVSKNDFEYLQKFITYLG